MAESGPHDRSSSAPRPGSPAPLAGAEASTRTHGFLFADLRDYTSYVEAHGDHAGAELLRRYRALVAAFEARPLNVVGRLMTRQEILRALRAAAGMFAGLGDQAGAGPSGPGGEAPAGRPAGNLCATDNAGSLPT